VLVACARARARALPSRTYKETRRRGTPVITRADWWNQATSHFVVESVRINTGLLIPSRLRRSGGSRYRRRSSRIHANRAHTHARARPPRGHSADPSIRHIGPESCSERVSLRDLGFFRVRATSSWTFGDRAAWWASRNARTSRILLAWIDARALITRRSGRGRPRAGTDPWSSRGQP
jgi:hypothetical protein